MTHGKRGPSGGFIDIDDPCERDLVREAVHAHVRKAFGMVVWAAQERQAKRPGNEALMLNRATDHLVDAFRAASEQTELQAQEGNDG